MQFEFVAGCRSLDFLDTLSGRASEPVDRLQVVSDLEAWLDQAELSVKTCTAEDLVEARRLRSTIERIVVAHVEAQRLPRRDVCTIDEFAHHPNIPPKLLATTAPRSFAWSCAHAWSTLARDLIGLVLDGQPDRVRQCEKCRMWFVDRSRPGNRRWCASAAKCGNSERVMRYRSSKRSTIT